MARIPAGIIKINRMRNSPINAGESAAIWPLPAFSPTASASVESIVVLLLTDPSTDIFLGVQNSFRIIGRSCSQEGFKKIETCRVFCATNFRKERLLTDTEQDKETWLRLLASGDHGAFAEFVEKYKSDVFLCCRTLGLRDDEAEDVASETFLAAYRAIARYRRQAELGTWLWSIAYRQAVNFLRKNRRPRESVRAQDNNIQQEQTTKGLYENEQQELVWNAVKRLPGLWAMAVILYYREEKAIREIAEIMRIRQNTVKTYLFRARRRLKELLPDVLGEDIDDNR